MCEIQERRCGPSHEHISTVEQGKAQNTGSRQSQGEQRGVCPGDPGALQGTSHPLRCPSPSERSHSAKCPRESPATSEGAPDLMLFGLTNNPRKAQTSVKAFEEMLHNTRDNKPPLKPDTEDNQERARQKMSRQGCAEVEQGKAPERITRDRRSRKKRENQKSFSVVPPGRHASSKAVMARSSEGSASGYSRNSKCVPRHEPSVNELTLEVDAAGTTEEGLGAKSTLCAGRNTDFETHLSLAWSMCVTHSSASLGLSVVVAL